MHSVRVLTLLAPGVTLQRQMRRSFLLMALLATLACRRPPPQTLGDAAKRGSAAEVTALLNRDPSRLDLAGAEGETPLRIASAAGNVEAVRVLLQRGAATDLLDAHGRSALHLAALGDHVECVQLLVNAGADWKLEDLDGRTPLLEAVRA